MEYLIADTHFGHEKILSYCNRPFKSIEEHDRALIENWNEVVSEGDTVYHLGDIFLCSAEREKEIASQLKGTKLLVKGNHDRRSDSAYASLGFEVLMSPYQIERLLLTHRPIEVQPSKVNVHGHTHNYERPDLTSHICVSVEKTGYKPIALELVLDMAEDIWRLNG